MIRAVPRYPDPALMPLAQYAYYLADVMEYDPAVARACSLDETLPLDEARMLHAMTVAACEAGCAQ